MRRNKYKKHRNQSDSIKKNIYFKDRLSLSYKYITSKLIQKDSDKIKFKKIVFLVEYVNLVTSDMVVVSI